ncbi:MAG: PAS domain S-box-containing protein [Phenylobacterium sp.]|jgi:PAS domain S-box-containing protein
MTNNKSASSDLKALRENAQKRLGTRLSHDVEGMSIDDINALLHDLQTHQIELEMQNESLRQTQHELTESRNQFTELYDCAPVGYLITSSKGLIVQANLTFCKMLGVARAGVLNQRLSKFILADDQDVYYKHRGALQQPGNRQQCELRLENPPSTAIWVSLDSVVVQSPDADVGMVRSVLSDITQRKQLEIQLRQSQKMDALGTLAGGIAHDFNNILAIILGNIEICQMKQLQNSNQNRYFGAIIQATERATDLVKQIMTFSRMEVSQKKSVNLAPLIEETLKLFETTLPASIEIQLDLAPNCHNILADKSQLSQVLLNLCTNAFHAMQRHGGVLTVSLKERECQHCANHQIFDSNSRCLQLIVKDTGSGILPHNKALVYDPFFTTKEVGKGTGLGLAVVYSIVKSHEGSINIDSEYGQGTSVEICFPALSQPATTQIPRPIPRQSTALEQATSQANTGHILVVDDEPSLAMLYQEFIEEQGYQVTVCYNGASAKQQFLNDPNQFDLVLTDQSMPEMTGHELAQTLLKVRPDLPVILSTGYSSTLSEPEAKALGVRHYLEKPINLSVLGQIIGQCLNDDR